MNEKIKKYFANMFSNEDLSFVGKIEDADIVYEAAACPDGADHLFWYISLKDDRIVDIKFECAYCDPYMYVAADGICKAVITKTKEEIKNITSTTVKNILKIEDDILQSHIEGGLAILKQALGL